MYTKLITVETKQRFNIIQASENPFPLTSLVFILDTLLYWTHGVFLNGVTATEVSNDVTLNIAGSNYTFTKADNIHKKDLDIDLGVHQTTVGLSTYNISYTLKATDNHKLLQYIDRGQDDKAVYLSNLDDKLIIQAKDNIIRKYNEGNITYNATILDTKNSSINLTLNAFTFKLGGNQLTVYLARHDDSSTLPENNSTIKASRLGGNNDYGWVVMNQSNNGSGNSYYEIKISNAEHPKTYVKGSGYSAFTQLLSIYDVFTSPSGNVAGTNGAVPAPSVNNTDYFLNSTGGWSRALPTLSNNSYLYVNSSGVVQWKNAEDVNSEAITSNLILVHLSNSWTNVDNLSELLTASGSYLILITYGTLLYTGVFSYTTNGTDTDDEIMLHCAHQTETSGSFTRGRLYAKIGNSGDIVYLQLSTSVAENNINLVIKYKKLL